MELQGVVQNGVVVPDYPTALPEGTRVRIVVLPGTGSLAVDESSEKLALDEWKCAFDAWMAEVERRAGRYPPGFVLDDSRETMYQGCGE